MCWVARLHKDFGFVCNPPIFSCSNWNEHQRAKVTHFFDHLFLLVRLEETNRSDTSWNLNRWKLMTSKKNWQNFPMVKRPMDTSTFGKPVARKRLLHARGCWTYTSFLRKRLVEVSLVGDLWICVPGEWWCWHRCGLHEKKVCAQVMHKTVMTSLKSFTPSRIPTLEIIHSW